MAITAIRTVIIYVFLIIAMRVMGKRQLGELQPVELVVTLLISDLAAVPMQESGLPLLNGLVPIAVLVSLELLLSGLMLKVPRVAQLISGSPIVLVRDGKLDQKALKRLRMTVEDFMETLRVQDVFDLTQVQYAIAETNGKISVFLKPAFQPPTCADVRAVSPDNGMPLVVIRDGRLCEWALEVCGVDARWVDKILLKNGCTQQDVFLMTADKGRRYHLIRKQTMTQEEAG